MSRDHGFSKNIRIQPGNMELSWCIVLVEKARIGCTT